MEAQNKRLLKLFHFGWLSHPHDFHYNRFIAQGFVILDVLSIQPQKIFHYLVCFKTIQAAYICSLNKENLLPSDQYPKTEHT